MGCRRGWGALCPPFPRPPPVLACLCTVSGPPASASSTSCLLHLHCPFLLISAFLLLFLPGGLRKCGPGGKGPQPDGPEKQPPAVEENSLWGARWRRRKRWRPQSEHLSHLTHLQWLPSLLLLKAVLLPLKLMGKVESHLSVLLLE